MMFAYQNALGSEDMTLLLKVNIGVKLVITNGGDITRKPNKAPMQLASLR